ncbi:hypothetical protein Lalb_Chr13g0294371 [Lupinus albus]|uniref:Uncharacterized protein n=1 Tax=Lupinus albus TaxID=3870 RepID=A0A6A4PHT0_LUPAL|nr:hypothetical protein Lalb_Chr13g0294371 [Lupinus albus]
MLESLLCLMLPEFPQDLRTLMCLVPITTSTHVIAASLLSLIIIERGLLYLEYCKRLKARTFRLNIAIMILHCRDTHLIHKPHALQGHIEVQINAPWNCCRLTATLLEHAELVEVQKYNLKSIK